jgi:DNA mismatch repair protein MutS
MTLTPMMQQYMDIKKDYPDAILFFRLGDFYEMFFDDAILASKAMDVTLTGKSCGLEERAPMCGVPHHACEQYIAKLIEKGYKVAICEQMEDPATSKGLVKREVVRVITPGTAMSGGLLDEKENNFLVSAFIEKGSGALAYCDISTGEIGAIDLTGKRMKEDIINEIIKMSAREVLILSTVDSLKKDLIDSLNNLSDAYVTLLDPAYCSLESAKKKVLKQFNTKSLKGIGLSESTMSVMALGVLLTYLYETQKQGLSHITTLKVSDLKNSMSLDKATIRNLELTETLYEKKLKGSLLGVLDKTCTAMGSRKMKQWIKEPLNHLEEINERLNAVDTLLNNIILRSDLRKRLKQVYDLERLIARIAYGSANGRDISSLRNSIIVMPDIKGLLKESESALLEKIRDEIHDLQELSDIIGQSIVQDPPHTVREGGLIQEGYSKELDDLKDSIKDGQIWIAELEGKERDRTGIKNLKVGFNKVFGYFIEVTKSYYDMVPEDYIRKQTLVNCERFITPSLKEVEAVVLNGEAKINRLEYELFQKVREDVKAYTESIQETSKAIASLDILISFAEVSVNLGYIKPEVCDLPDLQIESGRHPVLEQIIEDGVFVSNDLFMNDKDQSLLLITGPNMSGKSTYMRQTALIVLMAQIGCFVPAAKAKIGLVDRIYTRIGASDNLTKGMSTFFIEMSELAYILNTATEKSLILLDEIGRGTSTYDGLSIAFAVMDYLCNPSFKARTLFATHYHELTSLEGHIKGVKNLNVDVKDRGDDIVFLHKIVEGSTSKSYGIHVARLAGVPEGVLFKAADKLVELEEKSIDASTSEYVNTDGVKEERLEKQLSLFDFIEGSVLERLRSLDLMELTPSLAFKMLEELQNAVRK